MDSTLVARLSKFRVFRDQMDAGLEHERRTINRLTNRIAELKNESADLVKAVGLIDRCIEIVSANGIGKIESIVSGGLHQVFKDKTLGLVVEKKEGTRGYSYRLLIKHGDTVGNPMESFGGGVQNVTAFLLRVILIKRFKLAKLLVVDESFNNVSVDYIDAVSAMLKTLADNHGFSILAVTHQSLLAARANRIYRLNIVSGLPVLKVVGNDEIGDQTYDQTPEAPLPLEV